MRIGLFSDVNVASLNGITYVVNSTKRELEKMGHSVYVFLPSDKLRKKRKTDDNIFEISSTKGLIFDDFRFSVFMPPYLLRKIKKLNLDILHFMTPGQMGIMAMYTAKKLNIPLFYASRCNDIDRAVILRSHNGYSRKECIFSIIYQFVDRHREKLIAKYANLITFLNPLDKSCFVSRTHRNAEDIYIIPNNIGPPRFTDETRLKNTSLHISNIVYVGSLSPSKGLWDLLAAASILKQEALNLHYFILGRKENEKMTMFLIEKLNLLDDVSIEGYQDPFPYFIKYDLLVYPTLYDAFGNVIIEALHCGCPVLASNSAGPSYILKYDELLFNVGKPDEIAKKIKKNITNKESYSHIRKLCSERAKIFYFDWAERFEKTMSAYIKDNTK
jgi:1,2-diacylglycerol 3-alpha-glucosyltransferase